MGWTVEAWKASGGYGRIHVDGGKSKSLENRHKERIWFSPHCLGGMEDSPLFAAAPPPGNQTAAQENVSHD